LDFEGDFLMIKADRISGSFWLIFALIVIADSYRLGLGTLQRPGPGFVFFWAGVFLGILSLVTTLRAWGGKKTEEFEVSIFGKQNKMKIVLVLISVFLYAIFLEKLGFMLLTLLLLIFLLLFIEKKSWLYATLASIAMSAGAYLIFEIWLKSQLPKGFLEFLRF
jgi:putative tricarboxylic transport membrane protein